LRIVPFALETFGRLDYAFNNAGISGDNRLLTNQTEEIFDRVFAVNVKALFLLLQDEVKQMIAQGQGGSIVNTASVGGLLAFPTAGPYVASKHAVLGLTKTAAIEYGRCGIRVNAVSPGAVRTEMLLDVFGNQEALDRMGAVHPLGRIGRPEEIADGQNRSSRAKNDTAIVQTDSARSSHLISAIEIGECARQRSASGRFCAVFVGVRFACRTSETCFIRRP
jgi:NAD(P)-dependent dehydrogenase (short-subunit alcohol dehydrogenase family)